MKNIMWWVLGALIIIIGGVYWFLHHPQNTDLPSATDETGMATSTEEATTTDSQETRNEHPGETVIGTSAEDRDITAYHYGTGDKELLFIGGIHGGYEWNTALVAFEMKAYLDEHPEKVPEGYTVTVIPVLNPDGLYTVVGTDGLFDAEDVPDSLAATVPGRFNAHNVDLNRNFDCDWNQNAMWQNTKVSGGTSAFSEPESQAIRDYVDSHDVAGAVVWYSAAGGVFASNCHEGVLPETQTLTDIYAKASGYKAYQDFNFYEITGDMVNWFAKQDIPAISVLLTSHTDVEWDKNRAGIDAFLEHFAE
jgi:murein tripeptide amidase MpaA